MLRKSKHFNHYQWSKIEDWSVNKNDIDSEITEHKQNSRTTNFFTHLFLEVNQDDIFSVVNVTLGNYCTVINCRGLSIPPTKYSGSKLQGTKSIFSDSDPQRTATSVEAWHSKATLICRHAHPNIFHTVQMLQSIQVTNEAKIIQIIAGGKQRRMKRNFQQLETRLQQLKDRLRNDDITVLDFAAFASYLLHYMR